MAELQRTRKRVLAVASGGGHWHQLRLLDEAFCDADVTYVTTIEGLAEASESAVCAYVVPDCNASRIFDVMRCLASMTHVVAKTRPHLIVTTGAAPGLLAVALGRLMASRTIFIDSVANAEKLSLSARLAQWIAHECLTQWPVVAGGRVKYQGRLL